MQKPNPPEIPLIINGIEINATLNTSAATGLTSLFQNAALIAIATDTAQPLPPEVVSRLQSDIQTTANTLGDTLTEIAMNVGSNGNHAIPQGTLADFAATVGELLPFLTYLSDNLTTRA